MAPSYCRQPQHVPDAPSDEGKLFGVTTRNTTKGNATLGEAGSLSLLFRGSLALTNVPGPIPGPLAAAALPAFTKELFKLFMQTYMDNVTG